MSSLFFASFYPSLIETKKNTTKGGKEMTTYKEVKDAYNALIEKWRKTPQEATVTLLEDMQKVSDMAEQYANETPDELWDYPAAECFEIYDKLSTYISVLKKGGARA